MRRFNNNETRGRKEPQPRCQETTKNAAMADSTEANHNNTAQGAARVILGAVLKVGNSMSLLELLLCLCCRCEVNEKWRQSWTSTSLSKSSVALDNMSGDYPPVLLACLTRASSDWIVWCSFRDRKLAEIPALTVYESLLVAHTVLYDRVSICVFEACIY